VVPPYRPVRFPTVTTPAATAASPGLTVRTTELDDDDPLLSLLPAEHAVTWLRRDEGLVGWGVAAEIRTTGTTRFSDADKWWAETVARADVAGHLSSHTCSRGRARRRMT